MKQKIGVVCDDYKAEMMECELKAAGIEIVTKGNLTKGTIAFTVFSEQRLVKPVVDKVTQHFIDKYQKGN